MSRNVRRIPLKAELRLKDEQGEKKNITPDLTMAFNISSLRGCLQSRRACQNIDGFGRKHPRPTQYSIMLVDIAIYWQI